MKKDKMPVRFTGQHFTINKVLIADAISISKIHIHDTVLDIGAGKGFITVHLARKCKQVLAIENDKYLLRILSKKFSQNSKVKIIDGDFLKYNIPKKDFKVVSNIPYGISSEILKSLMFRNVGHFLGGALILQLETAEKLFTQKLYNPYSVFYHTFFEIKLMYEIDADSFMPPPKVKSALIHIEKRETPNINEDIKGRYLDFLVFMLRHPALPTQRVLKKIFRKRQVRDIARKYEINLASQVVYVSAKQWSACFQEMQELVPEKYHP